MCFRYKEIMANIIILRCYSWTYSFGNNIRHRELHPNKHCARFFFVWEANEPIPLIVHVPVKINMPSGEQMIYLLDLFRTSIIFWNSWNKLKYWIQHHVQLTIWIRGINNTEQKFLTYFQFANNLIDWDSMQIKVNCQCQTVS